jgi:hypothetical protein
MLQYGESRQNYLDSKWDDEFVNQTMSDLDWARECLQADNVEYTMWSNRDKRCYAELLYPNGYFVYSPNGNVIDPSNWKLVDFVTSNIAV